MYTEARVKSYYIVVKILRMHAFMCSFYQRKCTIKNFNFYDHYESNYRSDS